MQALGLIRSVFYFSCNSSFLLHKTGSIPKAPLSRLEGFQRSFIYLFTYFERQDGLPASFAQPSWIPSNSSSTPSFTHPNPTAAGHLGNAAAHRMVQVRKSQEGERFKALDLFLPSQTCCWLHLSLSTMLLFPPFKPFSALASPQTVTLSRASSVRSSSTTKHT